MTAPRDPDRLIGAFLAEGRTELSNRAYDEVRDRIDRTRQRVVIGPWREPHMPAFARVAIAAAAVVIVAILGVNALGGRGPAVGGPGTTSPATSGPESPAPVPVSAAGESLAPGTYILDDPGLSPVPFTFTVPAGWISLGGSFFGKVGTGDREQLLNVQFGPWIVENLYADLCDWRGNELEPPVGASAEDLADALAAQAGDDAVGPTDVTFGGYPAKKVEVVLPADLDVSTCDSEQIARWSAGDADGYPHTYGAAQRNIVYIVDIPEGRLVIDTSYVPDASAADRAELDQAVASITFVP
jgi:hypothetical protein